MIKMKRWKGLGFGRDKDEIRSETRCVHKCTIPDIIKFTYYHCTSIDYSVHYEWSTLYFECTTQYYTLVLCYHIQM